MRWLWTCIWLALFGATQAISSNGNRLLVINEEPLEKEKYTQFWGDLEGRGFSLTFESPKHDKLALFSQGDRAYDHIILLPTRSKGLGPSLTPTILLEFIKQKGNILLCLSADSPIPSTISSLLLELDIHLPPDRTSLIVDHFSYDVNSAEDRHDVLLVPQPLALRPDLKNFFGGKGTIAFPRGVAQVLGSSSPLLAPIIRAQSTAYTYNPKEESDTVEEPFATGEQISLVSSMQARNSARFTVLGSVEALENKWFDAQVKLPKGKAVRTANRDFAKQLSAWTFAETGVLRVGKVKHHLNAVPKEPLSHHNETQLAHANPSIYRIKNDVTPNSTVFSTNFKLPDQHGIFAFRVNYKRPFLTNVDVKEEVTVRHFAHDEWPRSWMISAGWVWIAGIWVTVFGWIGFIGIWLWSEPASKQKTR
ncbi:MAG: hypothetical protein LQ351_002152 [Letrouitia transgressa]|nr:MAG: hypothetical protein LQ351_002152 [Letrouitia transgressa]